MNWALTYSLMNNLNTMQGWSPKTTNDHYRPCKMWNTWTCATLFLTYYFRLALSQALQLLRGLFARNVTLPLQYAIGLINAHAFITINTRPRFTSTLINSTTRETCCRIHTGSRYQISWQWTIRNIDSI